MSLYLSEAKLEKQKSNEKNETLFFFPLELGNISNHEPWK